MEALFQGGGVAAGSDLTVEIQYKISSASVALRGEGSGQFINILSTNIKIVGLKVIVGQ